jgi:hypothetical protein
MRTLNKGLIGAMKVTMIFIILLVSLFFIYNFAMPSSAYIISDAGSSTPSDLITDSSTQPSLWTEDVAGNLATDFLPEDTVVIKGSKFLPEANINLTVIRPDNSVDSYFVNAKENGDFYYEYKIETAGLYYYVIATDGFNNLKINFTDCYDCKQVHLFNDSSRTVQNYVFNPNDTIYARYVNLATGLTYTAKVRDGVTGKYVWNHTFYASSKNYNDSWTLPANSSISSNGKSWSWQIWGGGSLLTDCNKTFWVAILNTYNDSAYTFPKTVFSPGQTVYLLGEGFKPGYNCASSGGIKYIDPNGNTVATHCFNSSSTGEVKDSYTLLTNAPSGTWTVWAGWTTGGFKITHFNVTKSCSSYSSQSSCIADTKCEWCPQCSSTPGRYNGDGDRCVDKGTCSYSCLFDQCSAQCDSTHTCKDKCEGNVRYYSGLCDLLSTCTCSWVTENCDDGDVCTQDSCDPSSCKHTPIQNCCKTDSECPADYYTCKDNSVMFNDNYCDLSDHTCKETTIPGDDCNNYDQDSCSDTYHWVHQTGTCIEGQSKCAIASSTGDCRDDKYCNGQETCSAGGCVPGTPVDCSEYNIEGISTCFYDPDARGETFDWRNPFVSECKEDGSNTGHCTTGDKTINHVCADADNTDGVFNYNSQTQICDAECDGAGTECQNKCDGDTRYFNGNCDLSSCECSYSNENCNSQDGCYKYETGCEDRNYYCTPGSCEYSVSKRNTDYYDDYKYYCSDSTIRKHRTLHDFYCNGQCSDHTSLADDELVEDCSLQNGWKDIGNTRWTSTDQCIEKEEKEQEYKEYYCSENQNVECKYKVTDNQWVDTGNTRNKDDGTICDDGLYCTVNDQCNSGVCEGFPKDCSYLNDQCNDGVCSEELDRCEYNPFLTSTSCDNGIYCDGPDHCDAVNAGGLIPAVCVNLGPSIDCSYLDGKCQEGICDENKDKCIPDYSKYPESTPCEADGQFCTVDHCDGNGNCGYLKDYDCSKFDLKEIATCNWIPDDYHPTWDYASGFKSVCDEIKDECTKGSQTLTHTCADNDLTDTVPLGGCNAECDENVDCKDKCVDSVRYYGGVCDLLSTCACSWLHSEDCNNYDCTTPAPLICVGIGTDKIKETGDDYDCKGDKCGKIGTKDCSETWTCDDKRSCKNQLCGSDNPTCFKDNIDGWIWGTPPEKETNCGDGYDNDCDGLADCDDPDCKRTLNPPIKTIGEPKIKCEDEWCEYKITTLTSITLSCENSAKVKWRYALDGKWKDWHIDESPKVIFFPEESNHTLEAYCIDDCSESLHDIEKFKVEGTSFEIPLYTKWNLISVPFVLLNSDPNEVFKGLNVVKTVWTYDNGKWYVWIPGDEDSTLTSIDPGWGYWVLTNGNATLKIGGSLFSPITTPPSKKLQKGWNLIGYYGVEWQSYQIDSIECGNYKYGNYVYCALNTLVDTQQGFPRWGSLWSYDNCGNETTAHWNKLESCANKYWTEDKMYAGKGYWIEMDVKDSYAPASNCIWSKEFKCSYPTL